MKRIKFQAWADSEGIVFATLEAVKYQKEHNLIGSDAKFLYEVEADTPEEAMAVHHIKMGWEPYNPPGKAEVCPRGCGSAFYPKGSGQCPQCGEVC